MEKKAMMYYETMEAVSIVSRFEDFTPSAPEDKVSKAEQWRRAYFEVLSWKNTWGMTYECDIRSTGDHEPYLYLVFKVGNADSVCDWLEGLGYTKLRRTLISIAVVSEPWDEDDATDENGDYLFWYFE